MYSSNWSSCIQQDWGTSFSNLFFLLRICHTGFFIVNGYLVLRKKPIPQKLVKKIGRYLLLAFLWTMIFWIVDTARHRTITNPIIDTFSELFLQKGFFPHFWYLGSLILLYILVGFISKLLSLHEKCYWLISLGSLLLMIIIDIVNILRAARGLALIHHYVPQTLRLWTWTFYFFAFSDTNCNKLYKIQWIHSIKKHKWICFCILAGASVSYQFFIGFRLLSINLPEFFYDNLLAVSVAYIMFYCFKDIKIRNEVIKKIISELSADILGIYIIHLQVKRIVAHLIPQSSIYLQFVSIALVFILSAICTSILRRVPLLKKLVT